MPERVTARHWTRISALVDATLHCSAPSSPEAARNIEAGDEVEVAFDSGKIYNRTKGTEFQGQPFPEFMQKLIAAGGLVNYTNAKKNQ